jgi:hypothetical protein
VIQGQEPKVRRLGPRMKEEETKKERLEKKEKRIKGDIISPFICIPPPLW